MLLSDEELKQLLEQRTAPHVNLEGIKARIKEVTIHTMHYPLTICVAEMWNGYFVVGTSCAVSEENANARVGVHYAFADCIRQMWPLEGYRLKSNIANESEPAGK